MPRAAMTGDMITSLGMYKILGVRSAKSSSNSRSQVAGSCACGPMDVSRVLPIWRHQVCKSYGECIDAHPEKKTSELITKSFVLLFLLVCWADENATIAYHRVLQSF